MSGVDGDANEVIQTPAQAGRLKIRNQKLSIRSRSMIRPALNVNVRQQQCRAVKSMGAAADPREGIMRTAGVGEGPVGSACATVAVAVYAVLAVHVGAGRGRRAKRATRRSVRFTRRREKVVDTAADQPSGAGAAVVL